jgi:hypothetical protein
MMLPFFILIYAGIYYMHGRYAGRQLALTKVRACAWAYAQNGCPDPPPAECELVPAEEGDITAVRNMVGTVGQNIIDGIDAIPVVGDMLLDPIAILFGRPLRAYAYQDVRLPRPAFGPTEFRVGGAARNSDNSRRPHYYTLCNTVRQDWGDIAHGVFCDFVGLVTDSFPTCP